MVIADAPARALIIFGDGLIEALSDSHTNLHRLAKDGSCGFLALRNIPSHHATPNGRVLFEMQQILDMHDPLVNSAEGSYREENAMPSISERFMGMKAALITNSSIVRDMGKSAGFTLMNDKINFVKEETITSISDSVLPKPSIAALELIEMLGLGTKCNDSADSNELVLLHLGSGSNDDNLKYLDWINSLVGEVKALIQPGTKANDHLYLVLVLGYGDEAISHENIEAAKVPTLELLGQMPERVRVFRPKQSYKWKDGRQIDDVRDNHPLLVVHQMDGVTRRDETELLSFQDFIKNGSSLAILADRFLHEIAFKLWKAPKYGA